MTTGKMTIITDMGEGKSEIIDAISMADYLELKRKLKIAEDKIELIRDNIGYPSIIIDLANEALLAIMEE